MATIRDNLLKKINKKAQEIREKRVEAANNKTLEVAVFNFFKNIEESRQLHGGNSYDPQMFDSARRALHERLKSFDNKVKISVEYNVSDDLQSWGQSDVRGVTIWWSEIYIQKNNVDPTLYIDISQMLFI